MSFPRTGVALRYFVTLAASLLLAVALSACAGEGRDGASMEERMLEQEAKAHSLEESLEAVREENAALRDELADLQDEVPTQAASTAIREYPEEQADFEEVQGRQLADLEGGQTRTKERIADLEARVENLEQRASSQEGTGEYSATGEQQLDDLEERLRELETTGRSEQLETRLEELEETADKVQGLLPAVEKAFTALDSRLTLLEGTVADKTERLARGGGGETRVINFGAGYGAARSAVLVLPDPPPEGKIPLIVSLHGFGGDSFVHGSYVPLHGRVNRDGFALLLPNGKADPDGNRFWNATDGCCDKEGATLDDVGALHALVEEALGEFDGGPVYFFGHSNGGFMAYHMACKGLPGLRAVASLAGTSYVEDSSCEGAPPVSVLHIHGTADGVIRHDGDDGEGDAKGNGGPTLYAGAEEMVTRWSERTGCDWPEGAEPHASLDLDRYVAGAETEVYRVEEGCAEGIRIELWSGVGSGHAPGYGDEFVDALLDWLLSQD